MRPATRTISFGIVDGQAVFMDERTDSYFSLEGPDLAYLGEVLERGDPLGGDVRLCEAIGIAHASAEIVRAHCATPVRSLLDEAGPSALHLVDMVRAAHLVRHSRRLVRSQPIEIVLAKLVPAVDRTKTADHCRDDLVLQNRRFLNARRFVPAGGNCLVDSLALLRWLGTLRDQVALVFGVKLNPFAAHCWVQSDDFLLNDRSENVGAFVPIRVIRCSDATR